MRALAMCLLLGIAPSTRAAEPAQDAGAKDVETLDLSDLSSRVMSSWRTVAESAHKRLDKDPEDAIAWGELARALEHGGKRYAALTAWVRGYALSPQRVAPTLPRALALADELEEDVWLGEQLRDAFGVPMEPEARQQLALFVARHHFQRGRWGEAQGILPLIPRNSPFGLDAIVLQGAIFAQQQRYSDALPLMLVAYERAQAEDRGERYVSTLAMNAARTLFAAKGWEQAVGYYDKVPRSDPAWPRAQVEMAWAAFRAEDMNRTLGLLQTHEAPFFHTFYQPEAAMLRAQALYLLCKFPATTAAIDDFQARYQPILDTLDARVEQLAPGEALAEARREIEGEPTELPRMLWREVMWDGRLDRQLFALREARHELKGLDWVSRARDVLRDRFDTLQAATDERLRKALIYKRDELRDLLSNIELTRVDLLTLEAELYQRAAATGAPPTAPATKLEARKALRRKGLRVWPFQGEYWIDELGSYAVRTPSECPESLSQGR